MLVPGERHQRLARGFDGRNVLLEMDTPPPCF